MSCLWLLSEMSRLEILEKAKSSASKYSID
jgi:hypothetical protein